MQRRLPELAAGTSVTAVMASPVMTVDAETPVRALLRLFVAAGIGAAPVVDSRGALLGVVSKTDVLRAVYDDPSCADPEVPAEAPPARGSEVRASDLMTPGPITVPETASVAEAATLMAREHIHRLFVTGQAGALSGVVSAIDLVSWLGRDEHS